MKTLDLLEEAEAELTLMVSVFRDTPIGSSVMATLTRNQWTPLARTRLACADEFLKKLRAEIEAAKHAGLSGA